MYDKTSKGTVYYWGLISSKGVSVVIFATGFEYQYAKDEIKKNRDVIFIRKAKECDYYSKFRHEVFTHELTKSLQWWQIDFDESDWHRDINVKDFISENIEQWKAIQTNPYE